MPEFKTLSPIQSEAPAYRPLPSRATQVAQVGDEGQRAGQKLGEGETHDLSGNETHAEGVGHEEHGSGSPLTHHPAYQFSISGGIVIAAIAIWAVLSTRNLKKIPGGKTQSLAEMTVEGLTNFTKSAIGPGGERFVPLIGTLFIYILVSNLTGALPLIAKKEGEEVGTYFVGPMANISMTFALAFVVFCVVQYTAIKEQGLGNRLKHLAGPVWWLSWLIFPLEFIGELVRPMSLSIRLFGNIFGEEMIVAVLIGLLASLGPVAAILPLHFPIVLFGLLTAVVQAGVFCLLSCVYLQLAMEKHDDHGHEAHGHEGHHAAPAAAH